jgi:hypothetical protein
MDVGSRQILLEHMSRRSHEIIHTVSPRLAHAPLSILFLELTVFYNLRTEFHGSFTYIQYMTELINCRVNEYI